MPLRRPQPPAHKTLHLAKLKPGTCQTPTSRPPATLFLFSVCLYERDHCKRLSMSGVIRRLSHVTEHGVLRARPRRSVSELPSSESWEPVHGSSSAVDFHFPAAERGAAVGRRVDIPSAPAFESFARAPRSRIAGSRVRLFLIF